MLSGTAVRTSQSLQFIAALFNPDDLIEIRTLGKRNSQNWLRAKALTAGVIADMRTKADADRLNVYVGANPRKGKTGKADGVALARCLFVDFDGCEIDAADEIIGQANLPPPTLITNSGHGVHAWWRLAEPLTDLARWTAHQKALISACGSDPKVHDPPRIMRWPGFANYKGEPVESTICRRGPDGHDLATFPAAKKPDESGRKADESGHPPGERRDLRAMTAATLLNGVKEGERNQKLFDAACEMAGAGYLESEVKSRIREANSRSSPPLPDDEVDALLASALSKLRTSWVDETNDQNFGQWGGQQPPVPRETEKSPIKPLGPTPSTAPIRHRISNVTVIQGDEDEKIYIANPISEISTAIRSATDGQPRVIQGAMFALGEYDRTRIPGSEALRFLATEPALFAWLKERANVDWPGVFKKMAFTKDRSSTISPVTQRELYEHLRQNSPRDYVAVEVLPHEPTVSGVFYVPFDMPTGNGACLAEWVDRFNGETEEDFDLFLAALLTPAWGGPCGSRPAFVFSSAYGRGTGKTQTAERICDIYGGRVNISPPEKKTDWDRIKSRLLADSSLAARCVIIDNIKHKLSGSDLEGLISSPVIDGHKMYHGQFCRPNRLTFFLTANTPSLSQDLADRSVLIHVGAPQHGSDWAEWSLKFLEDNRAALLADIYGVMRGPTRCAIATENRDRWSMWQNAILSKMDNGNELAALIKSRRPDVDVDREDAEDIKAAIESEIAEMGYSLELQNVIISSDRMKSLLLHHGITSRDMNKRAVTTYLNNLMGASGPLMMLKRDNERRRSRGWVYTGENADNERVVMKNRDSGDAGDGLRRNERLDHE